MQTPTPSGLVKDLSGHGFHGTINGPSDVAGKIGRAREFDGIDDSIQAPGIHPGNNFTVGAWIVDNGSGVGGRMIIGRTGSYFLWIDNGVLRGEFFDGSDWI